MSLSRVVKKPGNIIFNEVVQIKEQVHEIKSEQQNLNYESEILPSSSEVQDDYHNKIDEAQRMIQAMNEEFEANCKTIYEQTRMDAYKQGYQEGLESSKTEVISRIKALSQNLIELEDKKNQYYMDEFEETQNKVHLLALEVASKIIRQKISDDNSILKSIVVDELKVRKRQNIKLVEVSRNAQLLIDELERELEAIGINLVQVDEETDHLIIEGEMGRYDISPKTQIKNIRRLFNTI